MQLYTITNITCCIQFPRIRSFHVNMFHGLASRSGRDYPRDKTIWASDPLGPELCIKRTTCSVPEVCQPSTHLVVSDHLAKQLSGLSNIRLVPVVFDRLVDVEYKAGDHSWFQRWGGEDPCDLIRRLPNVAPEASSIGKHYEVQCCRLRDVDHLYSDGKDLTISVGTPPGEETAIIRVSAKLLLDFPILWAADILVNEEAYRIIGPAIDLDYFIVREYTI